MSVILTSKDLPYLVELTYKVAMLPTAVVYDSRGRKLSEHISPPLDNYEQESIQRWQYTEVIEDLMENYPQLKKELSKVVYW